MRKKREEGYYDGFEKLVVEELAENGSLEDAFYVKDLLRRKLFMNCPIVQDTVGGIVHHILQFNREDAGLPPEDRQPILLYLTSAGGEEEPGYMLIDAIQNSITPVYTINLGFQYSMAFLIGLAGHKRFATKNARFLMHDGKGMILDSTSKMQDRMDYIRRSEQKLKDYVLSRSKLTGEEYDERVRTEWYLFADEAKEKGFTDYIIGEDCNIESIV